MSDFNVDEDDEDDQQDSAAGLFDDEPMIPDSGDPEDPEDPDGGGGVSAEPPKDPEDPDGDGGRDLPGVDIPWQKVGLAAVGLLPVAVLVAIAVFLGPIIAVSVTVGLTIGFLFVPMLTFLSQISQGIGGLFSKLYFKLGFFGYRQPVICWTQTKYVVKELDQLDSTDGVEWYDLFGHTVGFTYEPGPESWGPEVVSHGEIESRQPVTDGGTTESNLPKKYLPSEESRDSYGKYLPSRVRDSKYYVDAGMVLERFTNSADGEKSLNKLLEAKEVHGSGSGGIDDSTVFKASMFMGVVGALLGIGIFIVPAFI